MQFTPIRTVLSSTALALALTACGGGGSSDNDSGTVDPSETRTGVLRDAPVSGVAFLATPSGLTGITGETGDDGVPGSFEYVEGDTVSFSLNGLELGEVTAQAVVLPLDLAQGDADKAANLLVLLQSWTAILPKTSSRSNWPAASA